MIAGFLHLSTQPAPFCASYTLARRSVLPTTASWNSPLPSPLPFVPLGGAAGLLLGVRLMSPQKWPLAFRKGWPPLLESASIGRVPREELEKAGFRTSLPRFESQLWQLLVL